MSGSSCKSLGFRDSLKHFAVVLHHSASYFLHAGAKLAEIVVFLGDMENLVPVGVSWEHHHTLAVVGWHLGATRDCESARSGFVKVRGVAHQSLSGAWLNVANLGENREFHISLAVA